MKQLFITNFGNDKFVDLKQVQELISGYQADIDVLDAQLHAEIVGKEQMIVCYESKIQELEQQLKFHKSGMFVYRDTTLERQEIIEKLRKQLEEAIKVIKFYADSENYDREGVVFESKDDYTCDYGYKARTILKKLGEIND